MLKRVLILLSVLGVCSTLWAQKQATPKRQRSASKIDFGKIPEKLTYNPNPNDFGKIPEKLTNYNPNPIDFGQIPTRLVSYENSETPVRHESELLKIKETLLSQNAADLAEFVDQFRALAVYQQTQSDTGAQVAIELSTLMTHSQYAQDWNALRNLDSSLYSQLIAIAEEMASY